MIIQAGRRVDAADTPTVRFPSANIDLVRERIKRHFIKNKPVALVTSAACGTDLLALDIAGQMHIERVVLLPSSPELFRISSVTDRPGEWGAMFDRLLNEIQVQVLTVPEGQVGYLETNLRLLDKGQSLADIYKVPAKAMVVWDQKARSSDVTGHFLAQARRRRLPVIEISTL